MPVANKTKEDERRELKDAYVDAVKISGVDRRTLKSLHLINDNVLDKWLYVPDRYPDFKACWELNAFIRSTGLRQSNLLDKIIRRHKQRVFEISRRYREENGEIDRETYAGRRYMLNGKLVTISEACGILGFSTYQALHAAIAKEGISLNQDISHLRPKYRTKTKQKIQSEPNERKGFYMLNGDKVDLKALTEIHQTKPSTMRYRLRSKNVKVGDDISDIDLSGSRK